MKTYAIAWTEFYDNNITVEFYKAESKLEAAKACWEAHMMTGVEDEDSLTELNEVLDSFTCINDIIRDFFDCDENISEPVLVENC